MEWDTASVAAAGLDVLCLDTCSILDVIRDPTRADGGRVQERGDALHLIGLVEAGRLISIVAEQVVTELRDNFEQVEVEAEREMDRHRARIAQVDEVLGVFAPAVTTSLSHFTGHVARTRAWADRLVAASILYPTPSEAHGRAFARVNQARAPARRGKDSIKDCVIIESYIEMARALRVNAFAHRIVFASSNYNDYGGSGGFKGDLATDASAVGLDYARNLTVARYGLH